MTDQEIIIEVAKWDGIYFCDSKEFIEGVGGNICYRCGKEFVDPCHHVNHKKYLTSYDAIIPVIGKNLRTNSVALELFDILDKHWREQGKRVNWHDGSNLIMAVLQSTPQQLCIALLKAVGKYKE